MAYDTKPPAPMPLIKVASWLALNGWAKEAIAVRDAKDRIAELGREAELSKQVVAAHRKLCDERAVKIEELEFFQFTALALETHLQALAQRLECEIGEVVTKFDEELSRMDAERDKLREQLTAVARYFDGVAAGTGTLAAYDDAVAAVREFTNTGGE